MIPTRDISQDGLFARIPLTKGEVLAWQKKPRIGVSRWALKYRHVEHGPWKGKWRDAFTPYLIFPMEAVSLPFVRELVNVGPGQAGKTQVLYNAWGWGVHNRDMEMAIMLMPDENIAGKVCEKRLQKIVKLSPALRRLMTGGARSMNRYEIKLAGHDTYMAWAGSEATTEVFSAEFVGVDEPDAIKGYKPGDRLNSPISRARTRTQAYPHTGKIVVTGKCSTIGGPAWMALTDCDVVMVHGFECPECGGWQIPRVEQLNYPEGATAGQVQSEKLAAYVCECCGAELNDVAMNRAARLDAATIQAALALLDSGGPDAFYQAARLLGYRPQAWDSELWWWIPLDPGQAPPRPARVGVQFSAFPSPFVQLGEIAAQAIRARGDTEADHTLANRYLAIPHKHIAAARSEDHILRLCDERKPGRVPSGACALTVVADVQRAGFWFTLRAWEAGENLTSWLVRQGYVTTWTALEKVVFEDSYQTKTGDQVPVICGLIDSGDGTRTKEIYRWCAAHPGFLPSKGDSQPTRPWTYKMSNTTMAEHGIQLVLINTAHHKNDLMRRINVAPGDPGCWWLHTNHETPPPDGARLAGMLDGYARQLCSETRDESGKWIKIPGRDNHLLDCEAGQLVVADMLGIRHMQPEVPAPSQPRENRKAKVVSPRHARPAWMNRRR